MFKSHEQSVCPPPMEYLKAGDMYKGYVEIWKVTISYHPHFSEWGDTTYSGYPSRQYLRTVKLEEALGMGIEDPKNLIQREMDRIRIMGGADGR